MRLGSLALAVMIALCASSVRADDSDAKAKELDQLYQAVGKLERRIAELESQPKAPVSAGGAGSWAERVRVSGSAALGWLDGANGNIYEHGSVKLYDARFFIDADLARDARIGETLLFRDAGFAFEWNFYRVGMNANNAGDLYVDFRGIADQDWLNFTFGRFNIPFGEGYLRYGRGYYTDPFIALSNPSPWFWDEGAKLWGKFFDGKFSYVFSLTDGEGDANYLSNGSQQLTLKLAADPWEWLHLSVSGLRSGAIASDTSFDIASIWLGETIVSGFGAISGTPSFDHGVAIPDGPTKLHDIQIIGGDVIFKLPDTRIWLAYGGATIDSAGGTTYDRDVIYWLAEALVQLKLISPSLAPAYFAFRASGLGTYSDDEGYLFDFRNGAVGYNMSEYNTYALVVGMPIGEYITLKGQYAFQRIALVRGVTDPAVKAAAEHADFFGMEIGVHF
jgi:hypothetical protein